MTMSRVDDFDKMMRCDYRLSSSLSCDRKCEERERQVSQKI